MSQLLINQYLAELDRLRRVSGAQGESGRIGRRNIIAVLGGAAMAWPFAARAQQAMPVIGFLSPRTASGSQIYVGPFKRGLEEGGFAEGRNVTIDYRFADGRYEALPGLADELVRRPVSIILAAGGPPVSHAAKNATASIPIVFVNGSDPVADGTVQSIPHPGGNVTGVLLLARMLAAKVIDVQHDLLPNASNIAYLINPAFSGTADDFEVVERAARHFNLGLTFIRASSHSEIDQAFAALGQNRPDALIAQSEPVLNSLAGVTAARALSLHLPAVFGSREGVDAGGLASYGPSIAEAYREAGLYVTRILKGNKPADLPVLQPTKFELVINLNTAKQLGLTISREMLLRADDVIE